MITIQINGETREFRETTTVQALLQAIGLASSSVAVAVNSEVVPRSEFEKLSVKDQDRVEILRAVGGG